MYKPPSQAPAGLPGRAGTQGQSRARPLGTSRPLPEPRAGQNPPAAWLCRVLAEGAFCVWGSERALRHPSSPAPPTSPASGGSSRTGRPFHASAAAVTLSRSRAPPVRPRPPRAQRFPHAQHRPPGIPSPPSHLGSAGRPGERRGLRASRPAANRPRRPPLPGPAHLRREGACARAGLSPAPAGRQRAAPGTCGGRGEPGSRPREGNSAGQSRPERRSAPAEPRAARLPHRGLGERRGTSGITATQHSFLKSSSQCAALTSGSASCGAVPGLQGFPGSRCSHTAQRVPSWEQPLRDKGWHPDTHSLPRESLIPYISASISKETKQADCCKFLKHQSRQILHLY
ncbi:basic salivary proline-rich protein 4 [Haemorhous mexicanus]|uniref:basic salivary proline-rich protein 4 n=1 Tax=Haemorhous mexicanus TaxID=30427 RepID=UPI0028BE97DA|nr:basic salivary proline-rich protein 4 [Haemorhous mexicanus]